MDGLQTSNWPQIILMSCHLLILPNISTKCFVIHNLLLKPFDVFQTEILCVCLDVVQKSAGLCKVDAKVNSDRATSTGLPWDPETLTTELASLNG